MARMSFEGSIIPGSRFTGRGRGSFSESASCCSRELVSCFILCEFAGVDEIFERDELAQGVWANFVFVIVGLGEGPNVACEVDYAKGFAYCLYRCGKGGFVRGEDADYQFDGLRVFEFPHIKATEIYFLATEHTEDTEN